ncbi:MAG: hypothetical protein OSJ54_11180 [Oscillospiraceae bacterium]|nr:hypothetical protein [Oscillospiraceae bacterium]
MQITVRELMMSVFCGTLFYFLIIQIVQCFTAGRTGGISEEAAEDENCD